MAKVGARRTVVFPASAACKISAFRPVLQAEFAKPAPDRFPDVNIRPFEPVSLTYQYRCPIRVQRLAVQSSNGLRIQNCASDALRSDLNWRKQRSRAAAINHCQHLVLIRPPGP